MRQGQEESAERTPTQIAMWVVRTNRNHASGLPTLSSKQGQGVQDVFILEVFGRLECSMTQVGHFTAEAERSHQHCSRQHCGVYRECFDASRPFHSGGGAQPSALL